MVTRLCLCVYVRLCLYVVRLYYSIVYYMVFRRIYLYSCSRVMRTPTQLHTDICVVAWPDIHDMLWRSMHMVRRWRSATTVDSRKRWKGYGGRAFKEATGSHLEWINKITFFGSTFRCKCDIVTYIHTYMMSKCNMVYIHEHTICFVAMMRWGVRVGCAICVKWDLRARKRKYNAPSILSDCSRWI